MSSKLSESIQQQAAAEQARVQSWRQQQHRDIDRQAEELRIQQRKTASEEEEQVQRNIAQTDKTIETARKRRTIGIDTDRSALKEAKKEATEKQQKLQAAAKEDKKELTTAEAEAKAEVEAIAGEATTELEAQQKLAMSEVAKLQEDNVELDNGEWIDKEAYNILSPEDQAMINKLGVEGYNKYKQKEFESNNVKLSDGSWISYETYNSLPLEQQDILRTQGIAGYEKWQQEQIDASNADSWQALQDLITATGISSSVTQEQWNNMPPEEKQNTYDYLLKQNTVTTGNNEIVSKGWYEDLNPEFRAIVDTGGAAALDKYIEDNYVTTSNEELIDKEYYNSLTSEQKDYILRNGSDKFQQEYFVKLRGTQELIDKKEYEALSPEVQKMLQEKGLKETQDYIEKQQKDFEDKYVKLDNGDYVDKIEYDKMTFQEQSLLRTLGVAGYNAKKKQDLVSSMPKAAQDYAKLVSNDWFIKELESTKDMNDISAFVTLKGIGIIPQEAEMVKRNEDGSFDYNMPLNGYNIELESVDFNNITSNEFVNILYTVKNNNKYKATKEELLRTITPLSGSSQTGALTREEKIALDKWMKGLTTEQQKQVEKAIRNYDNNRLVDIISFIFPPAQALKTEITFADIKGTDWATGFANVALLFVAPAIGAIGKAGSVAAKAASIASKGIQAAGTAVYGTVLAVEWKDMSIKEKAINSVLTGIVAVPLARTAIKSLASKLNPKGAAVQALRQSEKQIAKNFTDALQKSYHPAVAKAYDKLARIQNTYIKAAYKGKTTAVLDQRLKNAADGFVKTLKKYVTKPVAEERELLNAIERMPEGIARNTKEMVRIATQSKVNVKQLKKAVAEAESKFKAKKEKYPDKPEMWSEDYINLIDAELKLRQFASTPINEKYKQLIKYKDKLETLKSYKSKSQTKRTKNIVEINKIETKIKNLETELMQELKRADVEWVPDSSGYKGGGTAVATKPAETTRISGSLATELKQHGRTLPTIGSSSGGSSQGSKQGTAVQTKPVDAISTKTIQRINESYQEFVKPKTSTGTKPKAVPFDAAALQSAITTVTSQGIKAAEDAIAANATSAEISSITSASIDAAIQTLPDTKIQDAIKTESSQLISAAIKTAQKIKTTPRKTIIIKDENGKPVEITKEQLKAAVGWKQGWAYWYIYPPAYGKGGKCRIVTKTPIKGIPIYKNAESAYKSLTKIGKGDLPGLIEIPMGITTMQIRTKGGKPTAQYKKKRVEIPRLRTTK